MIWAVLALYEHPENKKARPTSISGSMVKTPLTGVDRSTSWSLNFSETLLAQANLSCNITLPNVDPAAAIRYRNGNILIHPPLYKPTTFTVQYFDKPGSGKVVKEEKKTFEHPGGGWFYEADEVARCVRDGKIESETWGHDKSLLLMDAFDEVRQWLWHNEAHAHFASRSASREAMSFRRALRRCCPSTRLREKCPIDKMFSIANVLQDC